MTYNNPDIPELKRNKRLNAEQIDILKLLYKFRFASNKQIAAYQHKKSIRPVQNRLKILEDQKLIAKHYEKTYKLKGKPAAYYLLPDGARAMAANTDREPDEPINFTRIYKDKDVSEGFIAHCLNIFDAYLGLEALLPKKASLVFATKSKLNYEKYDYFPRPLPDAYVRIETHTGEKHFFLDIFEESQPYFVLVRRVKKYLAYSGDGYWDDTDATFPTILIACANNSVQKRLRKRIARELQDSYEEVTFATTTIQALKDIIEATGRVWLPIDEDGDDPDEPQKPVRLNDL